jgi:hypothetical protein
VKGKVYKNTRVRNADKKQPFFNGQIKKFNTGMVAGIETPNTNFRKNNIPDNKENGRQDYCRKNSFPTFYILHPAFETVQKWNQEGCNI